VMQAAHSRHHCRLQPSRDCRAQSPRDHPTDWYRKGSVRSSAGSAPTAQLGYRPRNRNRNRANRCWAKRYRYPRATGAVHWQTSRRVVEYIRAHYHQPVTLTGLCVYTGVGERTLRYRFRKACGLSVQQYLMSYRLHRGREMLSKRQVATVAEVARKFGIPDAGRFAQYFRALFDVLPREVLM